MDINKIREEIPKIFKASKQSDVIDWICENGNPCYVFTLHSKEKDLMTAASILVNFAYEAGIERGNEISISALTEAEIRENPLYQKGYEAGKENCSELKESAMSENWHDGYRRGYEDAAKNSKAWYVIDKHGERVHIGDTVETINGKTFVVNCLGDGYITRWSDDGLKQELFNSSYVEKVTTDTRERIIDELSDWLENGCLESECKELAEKFVSRVEALGM